MNNNTNNFTNFVNSANNTRNVRNNMYNLRQHMASYNRRVVNLPKKNTFRERKNKNGTSMYRNRGKISSIL